MEYHKINGLYKRYRKDLNDELPDGKQYGDFKIGEFACPEFEYLFNNDWIWSEKLDGTNIRIYLNPDGTYTLKGRTDKANIPKPLSEWISDWYYVNEDLINQTFNRDKNATIILYGEGVGEKIQGGGLFGKQHLKLFDIFISGWWLRKDDVDTIGKALNLDTPVIWIGTIQDAIDKVKTLPQSSFGDFTIEGYVGQPCVRLSDAGGHRIVTKIKVKDFT